MVIAGRRDAQDAADEACLYLMWDRQGMVEPWLVIAGKPDLNIPHGGTFDTEEYGETITFARSVISTRELS